MLINLHSHLEGRVRPATAAADLAAKTGLPEPAGGWEALRDGFTPDDVLTAAGAGLREGSQATGLPAGIVVAALHRRSPELNEAHEILAGVLRFGVDRASTAGAFLDDSVRAALVIRAGQPS